MEIEEEMPSSELLSSKKRYEVLNKIRSTIETRNIDISSLFKSSAFNKTTVFDVSAFGNLIAKIDQSLSEYEVQSLFREFDINEDGKLSYM